MVLTSQFFDGNTYSADDFAATYRSLLNTGVSPLPESLSVSATSNMVVKINPGIGIIKGRTFQLDSEQTFKIDQSDGSVNRIDSFVIRLDLTVGSEKIELLYIKGNYTNNPVAPVRTDLYYDLVICNIQVRAGTTEILQTDITDTRFNENVCGFMSTVVDTMNLTAFMNQQVALFHEWMNHLGNELDANQAANLLLQIDALREEVSKFESKLKRNKNISQRINLI